MSAPSERHKALVAYCSDYRCGDCPMNDRQFGCIDINDPCIVSLAMDALAAEGGDTRDPYWGTA